MNRGGRGREGGSGEPPARPGQPGYPGSPTGPAERAGVNDAGAASERRSRRKGSRTRRWLLMLFVILIAFGAGFGWQYVRAESVEEELAQTRRELVFANLEATLAAAAFQVYRGAYEPARRLTSDFFTGLQSHVAEAPAGTRAELQSILAERDRLITLLSRAEPESREALARLYSRYRSATSGPGPAEPDDAPEAGPAEGAPGTPGTAR